MKALSLERINRQSPYRVIASSAGDYLFSTEKGINYAISFIEEFPLGGCMCYQFCIHNANKVHGNFDEKIRQTIILIIEEFFVENMNVLLYICDTSDSREAARNRLFISWFKKYASAGQYIIRLADATIEGQGFYSAIIVEKHNSMLEDIVEDFENSAEKLQEK